MVKSQKSMVKSQWSMATSLCGSPLTVSYLLFLDLDQNGTQETVVNSQQPPSAGMVRFGNANNPDYTGGEARMFDQRPVQALFRYKFAIETKTAGGMTTARMRWRSAASLVGGAILQLPYGTHRIRWTVKNAAGEEAVCEYQVVVKDCGKPVPVCAAGGFQFSIQPTGEATLWASDFLAALKDNYWPNSKLQIGVRKVGMGTGFPLDNQGFAQTRITFNCNEVGNNVVELWVRDPSGNIQSCISSVNIANTYQYCGPKDGRITVCAVRYCNDKPITNFKVTVGSFHEIMTDSAGCKILEFSGWDPGSNGLVFVFSDDDPLGGIDQTDLDLIGKHYAGLQQLPTPWGLIAADINKSGSVTGFDISELGKLLDGTYIEFPNNTSWRFIPDGFLFPDPGNPFKDAVGCYGQSGQHLQCLPPHWSG